MHLKLCLLFFLSLNVARGEDDEGNRTASSDKTVVNGKTYFIQLKRTGEAGEEGEAPSYVKINHYRGEYGHGEEQKNLWRRKYEEMFGRAENVPENLKEAPYDVEEFKDPFDSPNYIDPDWSSKIDHSGYDLPNITHDIYEAMLEEKKREGLRNATTVKFFFETDTNLTSNVIRFDVDSLENVTDRIVDAELHVYRLPRDANASKPTSSENVVRLYQMTDSGESSEETNSTKTPDVHKLANVIYISSNYAGWQVFKVKNVIENWRNGEENLGFLISTTDSWENEDSVTFAHREVNGGKYQPTLVVYLDRHDSENRNGRVRKAKNPLLKAAKAFSDLVSRSFDPCRRHVWYVSFHELGWNSFIIAPTGYMAYRCKGGCGSPSTAVFSNHGKLLNMFRRTGDSRSAACVPNGYSSLLVMYYDRESNVVIKEYDDMVVTGCGCR